MIIQHLSENATSFLKKFVLYWKKYASQEVRPAFTLGGAGGGVVY